MSADLMTLIISNVPNFVGFAVLAYVQYISYVRQLRQYEQLFDAYQRLLEDCLPDSDAAFVASDKCGGK